MEEKFTQGPLQVKEDKTFSTGGCCVYKQIGAQQIIVARFPYGTLIPVLKNDKWKENRANANLARLAPELYNSLKSSNAWLEKILKIIPQDTDMAKILKHGITLNQDLLNEVNKTI